MLLDNTKYEYLVKKLLSPRTIQTSKLSWSQKRYDSLHPYSAALMYLSRLLTKRTKIAVMTIWMTQVGRERKERRDQQRSVPFEIQV
jgi:hypothetical protein